MSWISRQRAAYVAAAAVLVLVGWRWSFAGGAPPTGADAVPVQVATYAGPPAASPVAEAVVVHVVGRVRHPGVYRLRPGARLQAALKAAGGVRAGADLQAVNLAAPAVDGQQVVVPRRGAVARTSPTPAAPDGPISLSQATPAQLEEIDGIGPALAARIVAWREEHGPFGSVDALTEVPGIGDARLDALRAAVVP